MPRLKIRASGGGQAGGSGDGVSDKPKPPTSDELSDKQLAVTFTHQALAVREALLKNNAARKRVLALILHDKLRSEALSIRHEANSTTLHVDLGEGFLSKSRTRVLEMREKADPFLAENFVEDVQAYERFGDLSDAKLDALISVLVVECLTAHLQQPTELIQRLASELEINVRDHWTPDAEWLSSFQKIQLAHLIVELKGPVHAPAPEKKKSELVQVLSKLFADAAEGKLEDKQLAEKVNAWLPSNLREAKEEATKKKERRARKRK